MKNSMVLLELIMSLLLFSVVALISSKMIYTLLKKNQSQSTIVVNNLLLETTRLFFEKHTDMSQYSKIDTNLYYKGTLLLENISKYEISTQNNIQTVDICISDNALCQIWKIKL